MASIALYLVRHAIAAERGPDYPRDDERPLTSRGRSRMKAVVRGWRTLEPNLEVILTSPLVRAESTAEIVRKGLGGGIRVERSATLAPGHQPPAVASVLSRFKRAKAIALVGHEPDLGALAAWLIGAHEPIPFKKGGIARIDVPRLPPDQTGQLVWMATPKMLRALA
jgi:phosphohistidine phosphatase